MCYIHAGKVACTWFLRIATREQVTHDMTHKYGPKLQNASHERLETWAFFGDLCTSDWERTPWSKSPCLGNGNANSKAAVWKL